MPTTARASAKQKLPVALAKRASAAAAAKSTRLLREAREQLALIARRKREITEAFYDVGVALTFLKTKDVIRVLGRRSFAEVCEKDAGLSASSSERLVRIVGAMTREQALAMGQSKATAMVNLAAATREDDTAAGLFRKKSVALPGGHRVSRSQLARTSRLRLLETGGTSRTSSSNAARRSSASTSRASPRAKTAESESPSRFAIRFAAASCAFPTEMLIFFASIGRG